MAGAAQAGAGGDPGGRGRRWTGTLVELLLTFAGLLAVTFAIGRLMPIDPVVAAGGADLNPEQYARLRAQLGLDAPLPMQFVQFVGNLLTGDFGRSFLTGNPVSQDILRVFPATLELATLGTLIGAAIGIPAGIVAAVRQGGAVDAIVRVLTLVGYSMPVFWKGLMLLLLFYVMLGWAEGPGRYGVAFEGLVPTRTGLMLVDAALAGDWEAWRDAFAHLVLPAASLGYGAGAYLARMTRSFVLEQLRQEYVTTARVKGASEMRVVMRHVLPNCGVQLVTTLALTYGLLLEGAVLTETVFAWPGLGQYMTRAMFNADMNAVLGGTFVIGAVFVVLNLLSDAAYRWLDPRGAVSGTRAWLLDAAPASRWQARCGRLYVGWLGFRSSPAALAGLAIVALLVACAILAPWLATHDPYAQDLRNMLKPPSAAHWLGTDELGRDIWSRVVYGARVTLGIVFTVAVLAAPIGLAIGCTAGYLGGRVDRALMRMTDIALAFPRLVLALAFVAALRPSLQNAVIAIALTAWPPYARLARAETMVLRGSDYIAAVRLAGAGAGRIVLRQIVPLCLPSLVVRVTLDMAGVILIAAGLGFLGLGAQPPTAEWGVMLSNGRDFLLDAWWVATMPGAAIFITSLGFNLLGDGLRDALDPRRAA